MKFYTVKQPNYQEMNASRVELGIGLLKVRDDINCVGNNSPDNTII